MTLFLTTLLLMCSIRVVAQTRAVAKPVKSFTIQAPDTVTQGETFTVTYTLSATQWDAGYVPETRGGFAVQHVRYDQQLSHPYSTMTATVDYLTSQTGDVELPTMSVGVGGKTVVSDTRRVHVRPHPVYGRELTAAHDWLLRKGANADSLALAAQLTDDHVLVFSDNRQGCFAVMARADVWDALRQPILAYSLESAMYDVDTSVQQVLLSVYGRQIDSIKHAAPVAQTVPVSTGSVSPMLGRLSWGQNAPYNVRSPRVGKQRILIGCVPLALAMVMKHYAWPEQGESDVYVSPEVSQLFNYKFMKFTPHWDEYRDRYAKEDVEAAGDLSQTLGVLSLCTDPDITLNSVSVNLTYMKHLMCNNLRYSGRLAVEQMMDVDATEVCQLLRSELDSCRPCIVARGRHAFVCDGYDEGFFHYNLGWHGYGNGYYQMAIGKGGSGTQMVDAIAYGMEPRRSEMTKEVTLAKPNTLRTLLSEEEQQGLTSLSIVGPIGSDDVRLLRQMAGGTDAHSLVRYPWGALRRLNLAKAKIVKDKGEYLVSRARGKYWRTQTSGEFSGTGLGHIYTDVKTFDFDTMDEKQWSTFKAFIGTKQDGVFYTRTDDNKYWAHYNLQANTVGMYMFANCSSLCEVILPEGTKRIDNYAFSGCQSIQVLKIPAKTKELGSTPFDYMPSLVELWIPKGIQFQGKINDHCSPAFKAKGYE